MYLTQEEFNVLNCKINGLRNIEISKKYNISETKVSIIYHNLLEKYGVIDLLQLLKKVDLNEIKIIESH